MMKVLKYNYRNNAVITRAICSFCFGVLANMYYKNWMNNDTEAIGKDFVIETIQY